MMQRVVRTITAVALFVGAFAVTPVAAHVAPSVNDNNRYLKITPGADRVRVAYTVFYGERPGAQLRPTLDTDKTGQLSEAEGQAFGERVAAEVREGLEVAIDGTEQAVTWTTVSVGLGAPSVTAGSFSVDLVTWICLPSAHGTHTLRLRDRFRVPSPGETEVKLEDGLGITIDRSRVGAVADVTHDYKFLGPGGPLTDDGLELAFTASTTAPLGDATCSVPARGSSWVRIVVVVVLGALTTFALTAYAARRARRERAQDRASQVARK